MRAPVVSVIGVIFSAGILWFYGFYLVTTFAEEGGYVTRSVRVFVRLSVCRLD